MKTLFSIVLACAVLGLVAYYMSADVPDTVPTKTSTEQNLLAHGLATDTSKRTIELDVILSGGPGKDGIPALSNPSFVPISEAEVGEETLGVFVVYEGEKRFYPYNILVWHEIVNDSIGDTHFAVTFCPLCGSAIVFDRRVGERVLAFGVSGLLFESNLLMYDRETESLWSQAKNAAVVGQYTGTTLSLLPMKLMTFSKLKKMHPEASVLSRETGHSRRYDVDPYAGYGLVDDLYFPVSVNDVRFPPKTIMYVVRVEDTPTAFSEALLTDSATYTHGDTLLTAKRVQDGIEVRVDGQIIPGYYKMWFSWATHNAGNGKVWDVTKSE